MTDPESRPEVIADSNVAIDTIGDTGDIQEISVPANSTLSVVLSCSSDVSYEVTLKEADSTDSLAETGGESCSRESTEAAIYSVEVEDKSDLEVVVHLPSESDYRLAVFQN